MPSVCTCELQVQCGQGRRQLRTHSGGEPGSGPIVATSCAAASGEIVVLRLAVQCGATWYCVV